jgi:hypothetical protein
VTGAGRLEVGRHLGEFVRQAEGPRLVPELSGLEDDGVLGSVLGRQPVAPAEPVLGDEQVRPVPGQEVESRLGGVDVLQELKEHLLEGTLQLGGPAGNLRHADPPFSPGTSGSFKGHCTP